MARSTTRSPLERATAEDVTSLVTDTASAPMQVGAVLRLDAPDGIDTVAGTKVIAERIRSVPRLRQRLIPVPFGCGRPVWVDDPAFDVARHVHGIVCPNGGGEESLLGAAAELVCAPLRRDRPLWSATFVSAVAPGQAALVVVFHHVLTDGIGGLAVLANLVDGAPVGRSSPPPSPPPSTAQLFIDALVGRLRSVSRLPSAMRGLWASRIEIRSARPRRPTPSSLNQPTGSRRRLAVVRADLERIRDAAHAHGATVNDVLLASVAGALGQLMAARGETVERLVVSVPVSARRHTSATDLGNQVGVVLVDLPTMGDRSRRIQATAAAMNAAKAAPRGASAALLGAAFRMLARLGVFHWFIDRQRLVNTFVTNLRGPDARLTFLGADISEVIPIAVVTGNVAVSFAALSYDDTLAVTIIADPEACPDLDVLADALQRQLDGLE